jgi:predicted TPR repeat methyltransferase
VAAYDRAIALKPEYADSWFHKGFALNKLGKNQEAIASFKKFLACAAPEYASQGKEIEQIISMLTPFA